MSLLKDKQAREKIERLEKEVHELRRQLSYYDTSKPILLDSTFGSPWTKLTANEIVVRFEELYALLGVDRKTTPGTSEKTALEKKKKKAAP